MHCFSHQFRFSLTLTIASLIFLTKNVVMHHTGMSIIITTITIIIITTTTIIIMITVCHRCSHIFFAATHGLSVWVRVVFSFSFSSQYYVCVFVELAGTLCVCDTRTVTALHYYTANCHVTLAEQLKSEIWNAVIVVVVVGAGPSGQSQLTCHHSLQFSAGGERKRLACIITDGEKEGKRDGPLMATVVFSFFSFSLSTGK